MSNGIVKWPKKWELAFLPLDTKEGQDYLREMRYCVDFAFANRKLMINRIVDIFIKETTMAPIETWHMRKT